MIGRKVLTNRAINSKLSMIEGRVINSKPVKAVLRQLISCTDKRRQTVQIDARKKMLYIMGIDWNWIYQRPQIIAEYLSKDYDVTVVYPVKIWDRCSARKDSSRGNGIRYLRIWTLPLQRKVGIIGLAADKYGSLLFKACQQYDYVYIDYPTYIKYIPADYKGCLIYDCIDDHAQMCVGGAARKEIERCEHTAIERSHLLLASSTKLLQKIAKQAGNKKVALIRNGTDFTKVYDAKENLVREQYTVGYIGTVAEWFDYGLLNRSAKEHPELSYHLIGPCTGPSPAAHTGLSYDGIVEHSVLQSYIKDYDCLIMPFIVNEIVKSVDPVKLYDYIAFGKCIISVWYEELEYFKDYVYFYTTYEEYDKLMKELICSGFPPKYSRQQQESFLRGNSWKERYKLIAEAIRQVDEKRKSQNESDECVRNQTGSHQDVPVGEGIGGKPENRKRRVPDRTASGNA